MTYTYNSYLGAALLGVAAIFSTTIGSATQVSAQETSGYEVVSKTTLNITGAVDYGHALGDLLSGKVAPPPQGARVDIAFEGKTTGVLSGTMKGVDFANIRADGRFEVNVKAEIVTPDGARISYEAVGVSIPQADGTGKIRETATLTTGSSKYAWVNGHSFIAEGFVNPATGLIELTLIK